MNCTQRHTYIGTLLCLRWYGDSDDVIMEDTYGFEFEWNIVLLENDKLWWALYFYGHVEMNKVAFKIYFEEPFNEVFNMNEIFHSFWFFYFYLFSILL